MIFYKYPSAWREYRRFSQGSPQYCSSHACPNLEPVSNNRTYSITVPSWSQTSVKMVLVEWSPNRNRFRSVSEVIDAKLSRVSFSPYLNWIGILWNCISFSCNCKSFHMRKISINTWMYKFRNAGMLCVFSGILECYVVFPECYVCFSKCYMCFWDSIHQDWPMGNSASSLAARSEVASAKSLT